MIGQELLTQAGWTVLIFYVALSCFEIFRFDELPMRLVAFLFAILAVAHGIHELNRLVDVMYGMPVDKETGIEILLPMILVGSRQIPIVRVLRYGRRRTV